MTVHLYSVCYNEIDILPFVIEYWKKFVSHAYIFDNGSTDGSVEFLNRFDWITVEHFDSDGMDDDILKDIKNNCWKKSRGIADFVVVCDIDEILYSNRIIDELEYMK